MYLLWKKQIELVAIWYFTFHLLSVPSGLSILYWVLLLHDEFDLLHHLVSILLKSYYRLNYKLHYRLHYRLHYLLKEWVSNQQAPETWGCIECSSNFMKIKFKRLKPLFTSARFVSTTSSTFRSTASIIGLGLANGSATGLTTVGFTMGLSPAKRSSEEGLVLRLNL